MGSLPQLSSSTKNTALPYTYRANNAQKAPQQWIIPMVTPTYKPTYEELLYDNNIERDDIKPDYTTKEPVSGMDQNIQKYDELIQNFSYLEILPGIKKNIIGFFSFINIGEVALSFINSEIDKKLETINTYIESEEYKNLSEEEKNKYKEEKQVYETLKNIPTIDEEVTFLALKSIIFSKKNTEKMKELYSLETIDKNLEIINKYMESEEYKNLSEEEKNKYKEEKQVYETLKKLHNDTDGNISITYEEAGKLRAFFSSERQQNYFTRNEVLHEIERYYYEDLQEKYEKLKSEGSTLHLKSDFITNEKYLEILRSGDEFKRIGSVDKEKQEDYIGDTQTFISEFFEALMGSDLEVTEEYVELDFDTYVDKTKDPNFMKDEYEKRKQFKNSFELFYQNDVDLIELLIAKPELINLESDKNYSTAYEIEGKYKYSDYAIIFSNMTEEERKLAGNIYKLEGIEELNKYLTYKQDEINKRIGMLAALKTIKELNTSDPKAVIDEMTELGLSEGVGSFFEGLGNTFGGADGKYSANDYEKMFLITLLNGENLEQFNLGTDVKENIKIIKSYNTKIVTGSYEISSSIGNMLPSITASTIVSIFGTPAAGKAVGNGLLLTSSYGTAKEEMLKQGYSEYESSIYGGMSATSEVALGYILGGIPGLSAMDDIPGLKGFLLNVAGEGFEEFTQSVLDPYLKHIATGQEYEVDWEEAKKAGIYGMITAGIMNGGTMVIDGVEMSVDSLTSDAISVIASAEASGIKIDYSKITDINYINSLKSQISTESTTTNVSQFESTNITNSNNINNQQNNETKLEQKIPTKSEENIKTLDEQITMANYYTSKGNFYTLKINDINEIKLDQLNQIQNQDSVYINFEDKNYSVSQIRRMLSCESELKYNLLQTVQDIYEPSFKARKLYMELNKILHYNMDYIKSGNETKTKILNQVTTFENLDVNNKVVCKGWSELYADLLISSGFNANSVRINTEGVHRWVEIDLGNGYIIQADATEAINNSIDLTASKAGYATSGFICLNNETGHFNGARPSKIVNSADYNELIIRNNEWLLSVDKYLGYAGDSGYFVDEITKSNDLFGNSKIASKLFESKIKLQNIQKIFDIELPENMDGYEAYAYYKKISNNLLGNDSRTIVLSTLYLKTDSGIEPINYMSYYDPSGTSMYQLYSTSLGKQRFNNIQEFEQFKNSLDLLEGGELYQK